MKLYSELRNAVTDTNRKKKKDVSKKIATIADSADIVRFTDDFSKEMRGEVVSLS